MLLFLWHLEAVAVHQFDDFRLLQRVEDSVGSFDNLRVAGSY
jgi:hypothetical protein